MPQPPQIRTRDTQTFPFIQIPLVFYTRFKPSSFAILAYNAIKCFASWKTGTSSHTSIPRMAALAGISLNTFRKGVAELRKKGAVRVYHRRMKGKRAALPNVYEIVDLQPQPDDPEF